MIEKENKHTILFVDDEQAITKALKRLFRKEGFNILTASGGSEGLEFLEKSEGKVSLIISDQRMPKMNGAEFLEKSRLICPDAVRFLLTGYSDMDAVVDAVNKGEIHRYMTKPWNDEDIVLQVRQGIAQYDLVAENRRLVELTKDQNEKLNDLNRNLEKKIYERSRVILQKNKELQVSNLRLEDSFKDAVRLLSSLIGTLNPGLGEYMRHVAFLSRCVGEEFGLKKEQLDQIELAGKIHDIGLLGLPEKILEKDVEGMTESEFKMFSQHPFIGSVCLESVEQLGKIGEFVLCHHECIDGSGFPSGISGDAIPLGARIIGAVGDYCKIVDTWPMQTSKIIDRTKKYTKIFKDIVFAEPKEMLDSIARELLVKGADKKYDSEVVKKLFKKIEELKALSSGKKNIKIDFRQLTEGMVLEEDVRINDGRLLLPKGTNLKEAAIKSILIVGDRNLINQKIHVSIKN